jgi:hypothetical protein
MSVEQTNSTQYSPIEMSSSECATKYIKSLVSNTINFAGWKQIINNNLSLDWDIKMSHSINISSKNNAYIIDETSGHFFRKRDIIESDMFNEIAQHTCSEVTKNTGRLTAKIVTKKTRKGIREFCIIDIVPTTEFIKDIETATQSYVKRCIDYIKMTDMSLIKKSINETNFNLKLMSTCINDYEFSDFDLLNVRKYELDDHICNHTLVDMLIDECKKNELGASVFIHAASSRKIDDCRLSINVWPIADSISYDEWCFA